MRIIAGSLKGRVFTSPHGHRTHPMSENIRGALFNTLGDIYGLSVLDAFSGSGALGFEAISRGADSVILVEADRLAQKTITENIATLGLEDKTKLIKATVSAWLSTSDDLFDIVLADPPYDDIQPKLLARLAERTKSGGIVVLSLPPKIELELPDSFELLATKSYGGATLAFYRRIS